MNNVASSQLLDLITDIWSKPEELALVHVSCKTTLIAVLEALLSFKEGLKIFGLDEHDQQQIDMCKGKVKKAFALFQLKVYKVQVCLRMEVGIIHLLKLIICGRITIHRAWSQAAILCLDSATGRPSSMASSIELRHLRWIT